MIKKTEYMFTWLGAERIIYIKNIIIPFFNKYPLVGTKSYEFEKFVNLIELLLTKKHISPSPLEIQREKFLSRSACSHL